jgi:hypothetical protein
MIKLKQDILFSAIFLIVLFFLTNVGFCKEEKFFSGQDKKGWHRG